MTLLVRRIAMAVLLAAIGGLAWLRMGPVDPELLERARPREVTVVDRNGIVLHETASASGVRAAWLSPDALPDRVVRATLAAEDRRFFSHTGVDPLATARALMRNVRAMRVVEGGSTLSQQVAKMLLRSSERTFRQKAREAVLALRLEHRHSKRELLAMYLNLAPYGNRIEGVARASHSYFGVAPARLTDAQAAFLAALPQRPSGFNPLRDPDAARSRQLWILDAMDLSPEARAQAKGERLAFSSDQTPVIAMHFVERVLRDAGARTERVRRIETTLDADLQRDVRGIIEMHRKLLLRHGARSVAVAVLDNRSGEWLAWEGSGDYFGREFGGAIDGVSTPRQPGSALKPFTYAVALESGVSPATVLPDIPSHFPTAEAGVLYTPRNYDGQYRGPMGLRAALAGSQNVPAVALLARTGPESLLRFLRASGFDSMNRTADYYGLGLTLGDAEVTLEDLVSAYSMLARGGETMAPVMLHGAPARERRRLLAPSTAFWITDVLSDAAAREYAFGSGSSLELPFTAAVKTGTSQAYRDNWTVGYTRDVTVGVWVGNFDRSPLRGSSGVTGAAPIFNAVMLAAVERVHGSLPVGDMRPLSDPPHGMESVEVCALSGTRPSTWCRDVRREWLPKHAPVQFCSWHRPGGTDWPPEYRDWARRHAPREEISDDSREAHSAIAFASQPPNSRVRAAKDDSLTILNPADGATFLIDPTLRAEFQTLRLRAAAPGPVAWFVDERPLRAAEWSLTPGTHEITARSSRGMRATIRIFVK